MDATEVKATKVRDLYVLVRNGQPGVFVYDSEAAARRVASRGHTVVRMTPAVEEAQRDV